ncbi:MAG: hypothetical protein KGJ80_10380, partial [Chloroflexota bacterium]|nr:hypothetical protein [Chloroflexota bacterium]
QKIPDDYAVSVRVTNPSGDALWAQADSQPSSGTEPTSAWQPGQIITDRHAVTIPSGTPPGTYAIQVVMYEVKTGAVANIVAPDSRRGQILALGNVDVIRPSRAPPAPTISNPIDAQWNEIALVGTGSLPDEIGAGDSLPLTLFWQARQKPTRDYRVHVIVIDSDGGWSASDIHRPGSATFPTRAWDFGETWVDKFQLPIDAGSALGDASVFVFVTAEQSDETLALQTRAPTRDLEIKGMVTAQDMLVHAVRIATVRIAAR